MMIQSSNSNDCVRHYSIKTLNLELQLVNNKPVIVKKLKVLLGGLKNFKTQAIVVLEYKKIDDHKSMGKIFHSSAKLIGNDSKTDKVFKSMYQNITR